MKVSGQNLAEHRIGGFVCGLEPAIDRSNWARSPRGLRARKRNHATSASDHQSRTNRDVIDLETQAAISRLDLRSFGRRKESR